MQKCSRLLFKNLFTNMFDSIVHHKHNMHNSVSAFQVLFDPQHGESDVVENQNQEVLHKRLLFASTLSL